MESNDPQLVRFDEILLSDDEKEPGPSEDKSSSSSSEDESESPEPTPISPAADKDRTDKIRQETVDLVLDCIVAPRRFSVEGTAETDPKRCTYLRKLSREPASRIEVAQLSQRFEDYLKKRQVRMQGYCPIRRELYDQLFDELIRQSTIHCPERGSLLLRVRDEFRLTLAAHEKLFENGIEYGTRKALEAEVEMQSLLIQHSQLESEKVRAEKRIKDLQAEIESEEILSRQRIDMMQLRHEEKMAFLKKANKQLKEQLSIIT